MAKKPTKTQIALISQCEEITRIFDYEGYDRVIERLNAIEGVEPPVFSEEDGWHIMTFAGIEARSAVPGQQLLDNWAAAARRQLLEVA